MKRGLLSGLLLLAALPAAAHEVPDDVAIHVFLKPSGNHMRILVRAPINAMIDTLFPQLPGPGFLDMEPSEAQLPGAARVWISDLLTLDENDHRLARPTVLQTRLSRQTDPSFASWDTALAHVEGPPLPSNSLLMLDRAMMDVLLEVPIHSDRSDFSFTPRFGRLGVRVMTTLSFLQPDGGIRVFEYEGDPDTYRLNPGWDQSAAHFIQAGFAHILSDPDHLWFLFCLVLLFRRVRALLPFIIAFTAAHSFALIGSAFDLAPAVPWLPVLAGTMVALSVVYMALECVVNKPGRSRLLAAVASGIFFGSGFWFFLSPVLQFGGDHKLISVLAFNLGIEMSQFLALAIMFPLSALFFRYVMAQRIGVLILAGLAGHAAWHRMTERAFMLSLVPVQWPALQSIGLPWFLFAALAGVILLALLPRFRPDAS